MKTKKADLSINMIVIVAICLVILVIMIFLIASRGRGLDNSTKCNARGGVCTTDTCEPEIGRDDNLCGPTERCCNPLNINRATP